MSLTPTTADRFCFGLWTAGYNGIEFLGGLTCHDNDLYRPRQE